MTQEIKLTRHRAKQKEAGVTRFSVQLDNEAVSLLRNLCQKHSKTQREFLGLAIMAADSFLARRLQVAKAAVKPTTSVIIRKLRERPQALEQVTSNTSKPPSPENKPTALQCKPVQTIDDDARIRAAAFVVEP